jgi:hypothetical protein
MRANINRPALAAVGRARACILPQCVSYLRMADANYRIIHRQDDSFAVEITRPGALAQTAAGFATEAEATNWIAQDKRLADGEDPFRTQAGGRWRGD